MWQIKRFPQDLAAHLCLNTTLNIFALSYRRSMNLNNAQKSSLGVKLSLAIGYNKEIFPKAVTAISKKKRPDSCNLERKP